MGCIYGRKVHSSGITSSGFGYQPPLSGQNPPDAAAKSIGKVCIEFFYQKICCKLKYKVKD
jgi:hypothetical protein